VSRFGWPLVIGRKTIKKRMRAKLKAVKVELRKSISEGGARCIRLAALAGIWPGAGSNPRPKLRFVRKL
jgi:hypothetical protein